MTTNQTAPRLFSLVMDHVSAKPQLPGHVAPAITVLAIYSHDRDTWRVADLDAWLEDDEERYDVALPADARGFHVEAACDEVLRAHAASKAVQS